MKQNIIQSIIRRGLSFVFLSLLMPLGVGAQTSYDLWIGNTQVTSANAADVLGDGTVSFSVATDPATGGSMNVLTLNGATIASGSIECGLDNLTIQLKGSNTVDNSIYYSGQTEGSSLTFTKDETETGICKLVIGNNSSQSAAISGFSSLNYGSGMSLAAAYPTEYNSEGLYNKTVLTKVENIKHATITSATVYPVWYNGEQVTSENAANLSNTDTPEVYFDIQTGTLTFNHSEQEYSKYAVAFDMPIVLNVNLVGNNAITLSEGATAFKSYNADAGLNFTTNKDNPGSMLVNYDGPFVDGMEMSQFSFENGLVLEEGADGYTIAKAYDIWIGGTRVNTINRENVLGESVATVQFDGDHTLTLTGVTIEGGIESGLSSLTIHFKGYNSLGTITSSNEDATLTFSGENDAQGNKPVLEIAQSDGYPWSGFSGNPTFEGKLAYFTFDGIGSIKNVPTPYMNVYEGMLEIEVDDPSIESCDYYYSIDYVNGADVAEKQYDVDNPESISGPCVITAHAVYTDDFNNTVESDNVEGILFGLTNTEVTVKVGQSVDIPTLVPVVDGSEDFTVEFSGGDDAIATIGNGKITGVSVDENKPAIFSCNLSSENDPSFYILNNDWMLDDLYVYVENPTAYGLSVNGISVNEVNRLDVLGDGGSVQFDGKNMLILNNANISGIYISDNHTLTNGLDIYLKGNNVIQNSSNAVYGTQIPLSISTSSDDPGSLAYICQACSLATANQAFNGYTVEYKNDLIATLDYTDTQIAENNEGKAYDNPTYIKQQTVTIAATLVPVVDHTGEVANLDGDPNGSGHGEGLGKELEGHQGDAQVITADKKMLMTLGENDGFFSWTPSTTGDNAELWDGEESAKLVVLSTEQNEIPANVEPGTLPFQTACKAVTMAVPAGRYEVSCEYKNLGNGQLTLQVGQGTDAQRHVFDKKATSGKASIVFATQRPRHIFLYNIVFSSEGLSRRHAPGRKMANTTTLKSVKVSARSVAATPPPVLMPKVLTKDDVAAAKSGNHITITDTDVTDYADDAFEGQTGITYVDLSATSITGKIIDRTKLPDDATVFLPASNDDNSAKNIVIAGVCNDLQLNDAVDFEIPSDFTAVKASLSRDFTSDLGKNCTVCVPFALDNTQAAELGTFYTLSAHSENTITMESVDATEANKAYMFKPAKETFSAEMVDVKKADPVRTTVSPLSFLGTYQQITGLNSTADFVYYCFMKDGPQAGKFVKITSAVTVSPFRAYMELPASESLARVLNLNFGEGGATGIGSLTPNPSSIGEGNVGFYDLQGRRVLYPKKGLYILNGKKVIIK